MSANRKGANDVKKYPGIPDSIVSQLLQGELSIRVADIEENTPKRAPVPADKPTMLDVINAATLLYPGNMELRIRFITTWLEKEDNEHGA